MTGQINVNKIAARTGNTITINSGDKISGAAGSIVAPGQILQVVSNHYTAIGSTSSTSLVASGVLANITPKFATSKILVDMRIQGILAAASASNVELALYNGTEGGTYSSLIIFNQISGYTNASDEREYGVWLDGKRIRNSELKKYSADQIHHYWKSVLHRNAKNYGVHTFQLNMYTNKYFEERLNNGTWINLLTIPKGGIEELKEQKKSGNKSGNHPFPG